MFSMEEEVSAKRPPVQRSAPPGQRASSLSDANASDDDDDDNFIRPILDDSTRDICHYLKNVVYARQLSNSLPKSNFMYKVSCCPGNRMQDDSQMYSKAKSICTCGNRALEDCLVMLTIKLKTLGVFSMLWSGIILNREQLFALYGEMICACLRTQTSVRDVRMYASDCLLKREAGQPPFYKCTL